ncbi:hypothetical protein NW759_003683 [Fusarium solani]|uniref:Uncharacterized protein n=1 Tax=Fusarium solani TaxID=169388 RepID=A0A9P9GU07_FUSSL|nr:uncharacterized protein B0J15DRAFT_564495 [Fusarium solani]KAH7244742.1 hypothetical protein B0J15DRAFT_564495 [Fusarium solani]KAJ4228963.1 hypothetical protein NW759_003683 [Fusarium solani]
MSVPQQSYYLDSEAYQKYLDNELRPTELLKPIKEGPVHLAPGEVFCRWQDSENGLMCFRRRPLVSTQALRQHYINMHKCEVVAPPEYEGIAANKKPSWPMNTDTDTTPAETQAAPASDVMTSEAELLQGVEFDELDMTGDEYIWREAWAAFDETAL